MNKAKKSEKLLLNKITSSAKTLQRHQHGLVVGQLITLIRQRALEKAKRKIQYLQGTMSLEKQEPDQAFLSELLNDEMKKNLESSASQLWEDD